MNWRALLAAALALIFRGLIVAKLGWPYRPFRDPFEILAFGRDFTLFLFLFGICLALINAVMGPAEDQ